MTSRLRYLLFLYLFWVLVFICFRWTFLSYNSEGFNILTFGELLTINLLGLRMDLSMAGYFLLIPALVIGISELMKKSPPAFFLNAFQYLLLLVSTLIVVTDLELYIHWGYRMDATPLLYIRPEGFGSVQPSTMIILIALFVGLLFSYTLLYRKFIGSMLTENERATRSTWTIFTFTLLLLIPIRSGFGIAPLNSGFVYFHPTKSFANHAGINVTWHFLRSLLYSDALQYPEKLAGTEEATAELKVMVPASTSGIQMVETTRPNILLIVLEGISAKIIGPLNGDARFAPRLSELAAEGILFDSLYASGDRTDKGIVSLLSGYPAQPRTSIVKYPSKTRQLPNWPQKMTSMGYHTSFAYGGDARFANMESYLVQSGFNNITQDDDFPESFPRSKWGVHDEHLFDQLISEIDSAREPFFKVALTLSSHEPFDVPFGKKSVNAGLEEMYLNSCRYTDSVLGNFLTVAKKRSWWKHTWIIITSDHGHKFPGGQEAMHPERFRIPMLWIGGAVTHPPTIVRKTASQTDIVNTVLAQLGSFDSDFTFSKNILDDETPRFAVYAYNNGVGYVGNGGAYTFDRDSKRYFTFKGTPPAKKDPAKLYLQALFLDYNSR